MELLFDQRAPGKVMADPHRGNHDRHSEFRVSCLWQPERGLIKTFSLLSSEDKSITCMFHSNLSLDRGSNRKTSQIEKVFIAKELCGRIESDEIFRCC